METKILSILSIFWIMNDLNAQISYPVTTKQEVVENLSWQSGCRSLPLA
jgi:hypothetical protein